MAYANFSQNNTKTNVQFFSGLQADLTSKITTGGAIEGAFYLTTDTQRLYVGRKVEGSSPEVVKAVQVSKGVTFVATAGDLPTPNASDVEEGELYYITSTNVLAALVLVPAQGSTAEHYEWKQINPPTGITSIEGNAVASSNDVIVKSKVATQAGDKTGQTKFIAGTNVHLSANGQETIDSIKTAKMTINADDTTYTIGTTATPNGNTDGATIKLSAAVNGTADSTKDSSINITGSNSVAVTSDANGNIDVKGPTISAVTVQNHTSDGFQIGLTATDGDNQNISITKGTLNPVIKYGQSGTTKTNGVKFQSGAATLDIYTKGETDTAIENKIKEKLAVADAMTYRGTIAPDTSNSKTLAQVFREKVIANGGLHNGDVYKISGIDSSISSIDGVTPDIGDLIIIDATKTNPPAQEDSTTGQIKIGTYTVDTSNTPYTANTNYNIEGILTYCTLIPSGDEPEVVATVTPSASNATASQFQLKDGKNGVNTNILLTKFQGKANKKILVTSEAVGSDGKSMLINVEHDTTARSDTNNTANTNLTNSTGSDFIGTGKKEFYVLPAGASNLTTDNFGHVTGLTTSKVVLEHNRVTKLIASYGTGDSSGLISIDRNDKIGGSSGLATNNQAKIKIASSSLDIVGDNTNKQLNINLVWNTF